MIMDEVSLQKGFPYSIGILSFAVFFVCPQIAIAAVQSILCHYNINQGMEV